MMGRYYPFTLSRKRLAQYNGSILKTIQWEVATFTPTRQPIKSRISIGFLSTFQCFGVLLINS